MKTARWRLLDTHGNQVDPGQCPEPWGTRDEAAHYLAWLLDLVEADVFERLVRIDLNTRPGLSRANHDPDAAQSRKETA